MGDKYASENNHTFTYEQIQNGKNCARFFSEQKSFFENTLGRGGGVVPDSSVGKESACSAGEPSSIPGLRGDPGEGKAYPLQDSGLENSMVCIVHGVTKS